eukprot:1160738-Pelagomonas_calceolata.AAC.3
MRMRTHLHAELIQAISNVLELPRTLYASIRSKPTLASLVMRGLTPAHTLQHSWTLRFQTPEIPPKISSGFQRRQCSKGCSTGFCVPSHGRKSDPHHSYTAPIYYLTYLTDKLKTHMHRKHKLGSADTSGYITKADRG